MRMGMGWLVLTVVTFSMAGAGAAQTAYRNGPPTECRCRIAVTEVASIGGPYVGLRSVVGVVDTLNGRLFTTNSDWAGQVFVYELPAIGGEVSEAAAQIGRRGDGPGEFRRVLGVAMRHDNALGLGK